VCIMKEHFEMEEPLSGKKDHFYGDRSFVLSKKQLEIVINNGLISDLYITDIGFYPTAKNHYRKRKKGVPGNILIYCIDGSGSIHINDEIYEITSDTYFIIPSCTPHSYWASEKTPWSIYWIHFAGAKSVFFRNHFGRVIPICRASKARIDDRIQLFNEILSALEMGVSKENIEYANLSLNALLASSFYVDTFRSVKGIQSSDPVDQTIFYMMQQLNKCIRIQELAGHVKLSESHLTKLFRQKTGTSPIDYFINLKMQEAIRLLSNRSMRIKEVAFQLGYNDPYYFTRIFTRQMGTSPATFLKAGMRL
jgi:AraC family transcriptional regulator, arabinose operon regulatory protein